MNLVLLVVSEVVLRSHVVLLVRMLTVEPLSSGSLTLSVLPTVEREIDVRQVESFVSMTHVKYLYVVLMPVLSHVEIRFPLVPTPVVLVPVLVWALCVVRVPLVRMILVWPSCVVKQRQPSRVALPSPLTLMLNVAVSHVLPARTAQRKEQHVSLMVHANLPVALEALSLSG